ncbi:hypothetical protein [Actinomadura alba]|uniref:Carboxypeptidase regulatory-like domain-containing protein n=1 Tax=Actinomadura alba TaxID=406431 RepID=A0ABR7LUD9_9ACTN|nr:hypothetical protein [Actinomadura alba]MBC6468452.1 hypothetical protein [Actinomadura alba]
MCIPLPASGETLLRITYAVVDTSQRPLVMLQSERDIQKVVARYRIAGTQEVVATREDFKSIQVNGQYHYWSSDSALSLDLGQYETDIEAWNVDGEHVTRINAGKYDTRIRTWFADFSVNPKSIDYDMQDVTLKGRLLSGTPGKDERPMAGVQVHGLRIPAETTTAADGSFTMTGRVNGLDVAAAYDGDPTHRSVESPDVDIEHVTQPTRLSLSVPASVAKGVKTTVTGLLERQRNGVWVRLPGETVSIAFHYPDNTWNWLPSVKTDAQGRFTAAVMIPASGMLSAESGGSWALQQSRVYSDMITVKTGTAISSFDAGPEPVGKGANVTVKGRIVRPVAAAGSQYVKGGYFDVDFSADGKSWSRVKSGRTNQDGYFSTPVTAERDGHWRVRYFGSSTDQVGDDLPSVSGTDYVDVKYRTAISSFNAAPEPVRKGATITVGGTLKRYVSSWGSWSGQWVYLYFQPRGSSAWTYMAVAKTDRYGKFRKGFKASRDGSWMAKYKGGTSYLPGSSAGDYVDVR